MGRTFIAEEYIQNIIDTYITNITRNAIGVIVGQLTNQKDYVVHLVKTPKEDDSNGTLDAIDDSWVANHAKQVSSMIPGGLHVIGLFALGPPEEMKNAQTKLRQVLYATEKVLKKQHILPEEEDGQITDRVVLQICSLTRKLVCRTYDVSDLKSGAKPADWKYQSFVDRWISLSANITVDFHIPVTGDMSSKSLKKQIQNGITPTCENIWNSLAVLNKQLYNESDLLDTSQQGGGKKKRQKEDLSALSFEVDLFSQMTKLESVKAPEVNECCAKMYVRGTMCCRAFVHNKAVAKEAVMALKGDAIRTLARRCELLCEDMLLDEEETDIKILYETPRRVFAKIPNTPLDICDYIFMDETSRDIIERMRDLIGVELSEEDVEVDCEKLPEESDLVKPEITTVLQSTSLPDKPAQAFFLKYINVMLGGAIAVLAAGMSYIFLGDR